MNHTLSPIPYRPIWIGLLILFTGCGGEMTPDGLPSGSTESLPRAESSGLTNVPIAIKFDDFSDASNLQFNGVAVANSNSLQLTQPVAFIVGTTFTSAAVPLHHNNSFSTYFRFRLTDPAGTGTTLGDGLMFVLQTDSNTQVGVRGGGIGYQGILNSFAVEFDSHLNTTFGDLDAHHLGTHLNGDVTQHLAYVTYANDWRDPATFNIWIDYDGTTQLLEVRVGEGTSVRPTDPLLSETIDLSTGLGSSPVYGGFTSGSGSSWTLAWIDGWYFQNDYAPIDVTNNTYVQGPTQLTLSASSPAHVSTLTATLTNFAGQPLANWPVTFSTDQGVLENSTATTGADGTCAVKLKAGDDIATANVTAVASNGLQDSASVRLLPEPYDVGFACAASGSGAGDLGWMLLMLLGAASLRRRRLT